MAENLIDHFTKPITWILFYQYVDYIMGHVRPVYIVEYFKEFPGIVPLECRFEQPVPVAVAAAVAGPWDIVCRYALLPPMIIRSVCVWGDRYIVIHTRVSLIVLSLLL